MLFGNGSLDQKATLLHAQEAAQQCQQAQVALLAVLHRLEYFQATLLAQALQCVFLGNAAV